MLNDKVLYQCPDCGGVCLRNGEAPVCKECFVVGISAQPSLMCQVWPNQWRSVKEPPPDGEYVLVWDGDSEMWAVAARDRRGVPRGHFWHCQEWMQIDNVTHWQPGPGRPKVPDAE